MAEPSRKGLPSGMEKSMKKDKKPLALIVDDGPGMNELLAVRLAHEGFDTESAVNAEEAEAKFAEACPDVMLVDYSLPGRNGLQLIEKLRIAGLSRGCEELPPFIVITGHGDERLAVEMMKLGAADYLVKDTDFLSKVGPAAARALRESRTRRLLRESENRYRDLVENINDAIFTLSAEARFTYISGAIRPISGYYPEEIIGREFTEWIHPDDLPELKRSFADSIAGRLTPAEFRFRRKDGSYGWGRTSSRPIIEKGRVAGLRGLLSDITGQKEAETLLGHSEARFHAFFHDMPMGVAVYRPVGGGADLEFVDFNPGAERIEGIKKESVIGRKVTELFPGIKELGLLKVFAEVSADGKPRTLTSSYYKDSRTRGWRENTVFRLPDGLIASVYRDTTAEETAKLEVKENEEKFRSLVEGSNDAVFVHTLGGGAGNFIEVNTAACERLGYTREELTRMGPTDIDAGGMEEAHGKALEELAREGRAIFEMFHRSKSGERIPVEVSARRFEYKGKPHIVSIARDIRELRRTEAALRKSEETFRQLVENAPDGIFIQLDKKLEYLNPEALRILGAGTEEELKGTSIFDRFHPDSHDTVRERVDLLMKEKKRVPEIEEVCLRLDGSRFPAMISAVPFEKDGKKGAIVTIRDITERKRMEEDLLKSQKIESLGMLAGGIAHDFNNILTGITANLSMLLSKLGGEGEAGEALNEALTAANTAKGLTRQLLAFAEGGKPVKKETNAGKVISEAARLALRGTPCSLELKVAPDLWSIEADETQLAQVIVNLCSNAAQAMPGGGRLAISAGNTERDGAPFIEVSVSDAGTGIPEKYLKSVFDPYFTTKKQGHGLGLPMAYSIVKGHGGDISVASESGKGTIFTVSLPATGRRPAPAAAPAAEPARGSGRVLVMDDEKVVLKACRRMITSLGYECTLAEDGAGALAAYENAAAEGNPFDAVIMDLTIQGGMGGKETIAELRKKHPGAKVIASSGYATGTPVSEYAAMGFDGLLAKPYNYEELAALLKKLIGGK